MNSRAARDSFPRTFFALSRLTIVRNFNCRPSEDSCSEESIGSNTTDHIPHKPEGLVEALSEIGRLAESAVLPSRSASLSRIENSWRGHRLMTAPRYSGPCK